ncbi:MAG: HAD family hydrolase [Deltaproteobacteria bacterium]|nr:HAD family hydrolase [Deltaproteobacteria bacterium]MBN2687703.1 HAD family hydrolase [Deltaproteobacteria bacterium]
MKKHRAVFMDRDGTINEEVGYLSRLEELKIFPETYEALRLINKSGMKAIVITNQSGVGRGFFGEEFVDTVHRRINELLKENGSFIDRFYYCPHHPVYGRGPYKISCDCRKPKPGLLLRAAEELQIDLAGSYMVGDMIKDLQAGHNAGIEKALLVKTGYGQNVVHAGTAAYVARDILDAVIWIMKDLDE